MSDAGPDFLTDNPFTNTFTSRIKNSVKIPKMLLSRVLQGNRQPDYVILGCGVSPDLTWGVDLQGRKLTGRWKRFAEQNSFEDDDMLVFEYCGCSRFHVGRYRTNSGNTQDDEAMGDEASFVTLTVTADNLRKSRVFLPQDFVQANELRKFAGKNIYMVVEDGMKFALNSI